LRAGEFNLTSNPRNLARRRPLREERMEERSWSRSWCGEEKLRRRNLEITAAAAISREARARAQAEARSRERRKPLAKQTPDRCLISTRSRVTGRP